MQTVCPGIHKVRVRPDTRCAVATCSDVISKSSSLLQIQSGGGRETNNVVCVTLLRLVVQLEIEVICNRYLPPRKESTQTLS